MHGLKHPQLVSCSAVPRNAEKAVGKGGCSAWFPVAPLRQVTRGTKESGVYSDPHSCTTPNVVPL